MAGGFECKNEVQSSNAELDLTQIQAFHEEADTRFILHCSHTDCNSIVVSSKDTDVLVLLIAHFEYINCNKVWMKTGTAKTTKYISMHTVYQNLNPQLINTLIPFHTLSGCDTT